MIILLVLSSKCGSKRNVDGPFEMECGSSSVCLITRNRYGNASNRSFDLYVWKYADSGHGCRIGNGIHHGKMILCYTSWKDDSSYTSRKDDSKSDHCIVLKRILRTFYYSCLPVFHR